MTLRLGSRRSHVLSRAAALALVIALHIAILLMLLRAIVPTLDRKAIEPLRVTPIDLPKPAPPLPPPPKAPPPHARVAPPSAPAHASTHAPDPSPAAPASPPPIIATPTPMPETIVAGIGDGTRADGRGNGGSGEGQGGSGSGGTGTAPKMMTIQWANWVRIPTQREFLPYLPRRALKEQVTGTAILICHITLKRRARRCSVESETPKGYGFGESALALSHIFLIWPVIIDGAPFDGAPVRIPVIFEKPAA